MRNVAALTALLLVFVIAGCNFGSGADATGKKWIALIEKHHSALEEGKFDAKAFKEEAKPIAEELKSKKDKKENKVLLTDATLTKFKEVSAAFEKLLMEKGTAYDRKAYTEMIDIWAGTEEPEGNAPANGG